MQTTARPFRNEETVILAWDDQRPCGIDKSPAHIIFPHLSDSGQHFGKIGRTVVYRSNHFVTPTIDESVFPGKFKIPFSIAGLTAPFAFGYDCHSFGKIPGIIVFQWNYDLSQRIDIPIAADGIRPLLYPGKA